MEVIKVRLVDSELVQPLDSELLAPAYPDLGPAPVSDGRILAGVSLYHQGLFDDSRAVLASMLSDEPGHWQAYYFLGLVDYRQEKYSWAARSFHVALEFCPDDMENRAIVCNALALSLEKTSDYGRAKQHFQAACDLDPKSPRARAGLERLTALTSIDDR